MKKFTHRIGKIDIEVSCSEEDYEWLHPLFLRNAKPFKALRDMGFDVLDKHAREESDNPQSKC